MTKRKNTELKSRRTSEDAAPLGGSVVPATSSRTASAWGMTPAAIRETIESVVIAFVLAFLFRTFEAEAFVIPTGSMAPTLMGKHKDLECPKCHYQYQVSASDDQRSNLPADVRGGTCPMCRFPADLAADNPQKSSYPSYDGDRILVAKFPYEFGDPKRWDIVVFKYPGDATMNYIKRLVGLPGETIRIRDGNLWVHKPGDPAIHFEIARKLPAKLLAMLQMVYDNDLAKTITGELGWPARWSADSAAGAWTSQDPRSFEADGASAETWIHYRHLVPTRGQWNNVESGKAGRGAVRAQLISDFTAYNTGDGPDHFGGGRNDAGVGGYGLHWVGDLAVQFQLEAQSAGGEVVAELVKGGRRFQCQFDLSSGKAELRIDGDGPVAANFHPSATTTVRGPGSHAITFANVDDALTLFVDGNVVAFDSPTTYDSDAVKTRIPTLADLSPVGIAARKASVKVNHLKVLRDVYYSAVRFGAEKPGALEDFIDFQPNLAEPEMWERDFARENMKVKDFPLAGPNPLHPDKDQFFVLGDNSGQSKDGRLWEREQWVERELLIGKALFIYWPHSWHKLPYTPIPFPFFPNFSRMHLVR